MPEIITALLGEHKLISDQVSKDQVEVILHQLQTVLEQGIDGAVVEFGCYIGTTSLFIRRLLDTVGTDREFHVYDSFEGLPPKSTWDSSVTGEGFTSGALSVSKKLFLREFRKASLKPPIIHKGWFRDIAPSNVPPHIAFAFLDGDFYESIRDSLRLILPKMRSGGAIVIDDYAREALPGVARAVHEKFSPECIRTIHNLGIVRL